MTGTHQTFDFNTFAERLIDAVTEKFKPATDELWDLEQVAQYLHCSTIHVRQNIAPLP